jgi:uncharacterized damage-inducible protein DinB
MQILVMLVLKSLDCQNADKLFIVYDNKKCANHLNNFEEDSMKTQEQIIQSTHRGMDIIFRTVRAMPEDKLDWKPMDAGRSALDQLQECSWSPNFYRMVLEQKTFPELDENFFDEASKQRKQWTTIDLCEEHCKENTEKLCSVIRSLSDEDLSTTIHIPTRGIDLSLADIALSHFAHMQYHTGQINYIQTLYGDADMH